LVNLLAVYRLTFLPLSGGADERAGAEEELAGGEEDLAGGAADLPDDDDDGGDACRPALLLLPLLPVLLELPRASLASLLFLDVPSDLAEVSLEPELRWGASALPVSPPSNLRCVWELLLPCSCRVSLPLRSLVS
jgi:hypothetical protein